MILTQSRVKFDRVKHEYWLDGVELRGVTGMLHNQLFQKMYADVDPAVLKRACERGTYYHELCELADNLGVDTGNNDVNKYTEIKNNKGWKHVSSEYLVSDEKNFASCIDKVFEVGENEVILADIKTTYTLNKEYVSWQLSIYAYMFQLMNPDIKVVGLYAIWLREQRCEFVPVPRVDTQYVVDLMAKEVAGETFVIPFNLPAEYADIEMQVVEMLTRVAETEAKIKELQERMKVMMDEANVTKWESARLVITRKADFTRKSLDSKALQSAHPEIYKEFEKVTTCRGGVTIKVKD